MYSSSGYLQLQLPSGQHESSKELWVSCVKGMMFISVHSVNCVFFANGLMTLLLKGHAIKQLYIIIVWFHVYHLVLSLMMHTI